MTSVKKERRLKIKRRIRKKVLGNPEKPRLSVFKSNKQISVQIIDDLNGKTIASATSLHKDIISAKGTKSEKSKMVGKLIAENAKSAGIEEVRFDRSGYLYHGRIKALADGAREGGLKF